MRVYTIRLILPDGCEVRTICAGYTKNDAVEQAIKLKGGDARLIYAREE